MDTMASQGDGKKRRSFLPAPKRASESQFAAPQASTIPRMIQSQLPTMQTASSVYPREPSQIPSFAPKESSQIPSFAPRPPPSVSFREQAKAPAGSSHFNERQKGESSFGTGLHVGAKVKIGGVKPGILRYLGPTHLAPGTFCGIELLDPDGNHNGVVNGHRYFFCLPNHGIFAPKEKVCLDTSDDLGNLVSDSEMFYSNTGSLSDKRHRTHKSYPEGEFSSKAFPMSSNTANAYCAQYTEDGAPSRRHRDIEGIGRSNLPSPYNPQTERPYNPQTGRSEPVQTYGFNEASAHRLSNYTPPSSQSPLPNYSRAYLKYQDEFNSQRCPAYSSQSDSSQTSSFEAPADIHDSISHFQTHEEYDRTAPVHTKHGSKPGHYFDNSLAQGTLSTDVKHQLDAGNRQFLNFTFDRDELNCSEDFSEMESDSSFYEEEFDTKGRNMVREDYLKYADVGNFRGISSALDKANNQQYHEHLRQTNTKSFVPAEDDNYPRSGNLDASVSDNYATFRAGLNAANSALKYGEGNASIVDYSLAEKGGSGLVTDFHPGTDERISEGYVPDTDSELGTLISNTPDADWVDKCGVPHPTTHAPLDEDATVAEKKEDNTLVKSAANVLSKTVAKATDDDDYNSDLTGNAEDDRVEADRLDGQNAKVATRADEPVNIDVSSKENMGNDSERYHKDESVTPELSPESPKTEDYKDGQSLHTEDTTQDNKGKPRKAVVITKKRSENVDHKMPNTNVTSRLADYIKAPVPVKSKEEKEKEKELKKNKNVKNASQSSKSKQETSRGSSEKGDNKVEEKPEKIEKPKPIIKRERPKSKWDNIMCQIEVSKDTVKVKPISEIKSSLAEYLHTPAPQLPTDDADIMPPHPRKEFKSKLKPLPPPPPKIDLSKVKSKLNVPTAASAIKAMPKREKPPKAVNLKNDNRATRESSTTLNAESALPENNDNMRKMSNSSLVPETTQAELSALENKDDSSTAHGNEGLSSKSSTADIKKDSHRSSIHSAKLENADKPKSSAEQVSKSGESLKKVSQASTFQSKKATTPAPKVTRNAVPSNIRSTRSTSKNITRKDFEQLESLCEARAEEVAQLKLHLDTTIQAFDAMAVLANYCSNELNAFECPALSQKLETVQRQLEDYAQQIAELNSQKAILDKDLDQLMQEKEKATQQTRAAQDGAQKERDDHEKLTQDLSHTHTTVLSTQRDELTSKHEETVNKLTQFYETQFELQRQAHDRQVSDIMNECKLEINSLKIANLEEVQELRNKHDDQMEELHKQHRCKMEDLSLRFEAIKFSLSEKVDCLRKECDDLVIRARNSEEALQRDSDFKVRIALAPFINLPREIESLKSIQGMRLEEIQKLRTKIVDLEKQLEEVPIAREKIISLHQKIENLEAIINIKTEHEKQLHQRCQVLMRKYDRESRANKRISMDFEQIMWRMSQSADFESSDDNLAKQQFSQSYHSGDVAPDSSRHSASLSRDSVHHARRRTSKNASEGDRKLRSKSANSVSGKGDNSCDHTTTAEPHLKVQTHTSTDQTAESDHFNRMCKSAGPEVMFELLSDNSCPQIQSDEHEEQTLTGPQGTSVFDMTRSYARSLSGVTDSGVYDSLTRSDVFNSSTASTDLELGMSVNLSGTCDDDLESGPAAGNYNLA